MTRRLWPLVFLALSCSGPQIAFDGSAFPEPLGETRALVLWVRFADDTLTNLNPITASAKAWAQPDELPFLARTVLSGSTRWPTGLTSYFLNQSQGQFRLTGESFPEVMVTESPEANYRSDDGTLDQTRLTRELLAAVDADGRIDLEDFDKDRDGFVDYLFVVLRSVRGTRLYPSHASGVSDIGYTSEVAELGSRSRLKVDRHASGSYVRYDNAGNIVPEVDMVRLMAHEIGHDLWRDFIHLRPVRPLPGVPPFVDRQVGYALMAGGSDARGDETISAYERALLGWIDCETLTRDTVVVVGDLYTSDHGNCFTYSVPRPAPGDVLRTIFLSNRQRIGPFDRLYIEVAPQARSEQGLMDTGLLVMATENGGRVGPVPADGSLNLSARASDYVGDLFKPGSRLTPWTQPNSAGYLSFPPTGLARFTGESEMLYPGLRVLGTEQDGALRIRFRRDERREAVFEDGDLIPVLPGLSFAGLASVTGAVEVLGSAHFPDGLDVGPGASLTIRGSVSTGMVRLAQGSTLEIVGALSVEAVEIDRARVTLGPAGRVAGSAADALMKAADGDW